MERSQPTAGDPDAAAVIDLRTLSDGVTRLKELVLALKAEVLAVVGRAGDEQP